MKKLVLAVALVAAGLAQAQTQVYGLIGVGAVSGQGFGASNQSFTGVGEQLHNSNRLGFKGTEDLGSGMTAKFTLESNFSARDGAVGKDSAGTGSNGTVFFDREANVALAGDFGQVQLGRGKNFLYNVLDEFDSRGNWNFGGLKPVARYAGFYSGSGISRFDNMIRYTSPDVAGFKFDFSQSQGNQLNDTGYKDSLNLGARYTAGAFDLAYTYEEARLTNTVVTERINLLAAKFAVTPALTVDAGYAITRNPAATTFYSSSSKVDGKTSADTAFIGAVYKINGNVSVNAGYYDVKDKVTAGINDVKMTAVGTTYALSKRTEIFADYVIANRAAGANAPFTINDRWIPNGDGSTYSDGTAGQRAIAVGVQHRF